MGWDVSVTQEGMGQALWQRHRRERTSLVWSQLWEGTDALRTPRTLAPCKAHLLPQVGPLQTLGPVGLTLTGSGSWVLGPGGLTLTGSGPWVHGVHTFSLIVFSAPVAHAQAG